MLGYSTFLSVQCWVLASSCTHSVTECNAGLCSLLVRAMQGSESDLYPQCGVKWLKFENLSFWKIILEYQVQLLQNTAGYQPRLIKLAKYGQISCCLAFRYQVHEIWAPNLKFLQYSWWVCICKAQKSEPLLKMRLWLPFCLEIP